MYNDFITCLDEAHLKEKKIVFEYPENDIDDVPSRTSINSSNYNNKTSITEEIVTELDSKNEYSDDYDLDDDFGDDLDIKI
jgi:hypothetical protein